MDLINHIPGVANSGIFLPGANTPAPWNVPHVGAVDGTSPLDATRNMAEIYNRMLLEFAAIVQAAGLAIDHANWTQAAQAIQSMTRAGGPAGQVSFFAQSAPPPGWLKANGATISRTAYGDLFAAIGTNYGSGDGATTFKVPDLRGAFLRSLDDFRGIDAYRFLGSAQDSQNLAHLHDVNDLGHVHSMYDGGHVHGGSTDAQGAHVHGVPAGVDGGFLFGGNAGINNNGAAQGVPFGGLGFGLALSQVATTGVSGSHAHNLAMQAANSNMGMYAAATGISLQAQGGNEARPYNIALSTFIKY